MELMSLREKDSEACVHQMQEVWNIEEIGWLCDCRHDETKVNIKNIELEFGGTADGGMEMLSFIKKSSRTY